MVSAVHNLRLNGQQRNRSALNTWRRRHAREGVAAREARATWCGSEGPGEGQGRGIHLERG